MVTAIRRPDYRAQADYRAKPTARARETERNWRLQRKAPDFGADGLAEIRFRMRAVSK